MANPSGGSGGGKAPPNGGPWLSFPVTGSVGMVPGSVPDASRGGAERHRGRSLQAAGYCFQGIEGDNGSGGGEAPGHWAWHGLSAVGQVVKLRVSLCPAVVRVVDMQQTKTYMARPGEIEQKWWLVDASDKVVGRLASDIGMVLMGRIAPRTRRTSITAITSS